MYLENVREGAIASARDRPGHCARVSKEGRAFWSWSVRVMRRWRVNAFANAYASVRHPAFVVGSKLH